MVQWELDLLGTMGKMGRGKRQEEAPQGMNVPVMMLLVPTGPHIIAVKEKLHAHM